MKALCRRLSLLLFILPLGLVQAQTLVNGVVRDAHTKAPLEMVGILEKLSGDWTVTDKEGRFSIRINPRQFELYFKLLGREDVVLTQDSSDSLGNLTVYLKENNLRLDEVTVTAGPVREKTGSAVILDKYAIEQFQAFSLAEVLGQLPGQTIRAPQMNSPNTVSLRTAFSSTNNQFGVSYVVDDMQVSNDENMQVYRSIARDDGNVTSFDNANNGLDLRSIPASNIDEVEVISGIPDARYGNLSSGIIKINRKAGESPFVASMGIREGSTSLNVNKGTNLGGNRGMLSLSLDYLNSNADPRQVLQSYNRVTFDAIWSANNRRKTFKNTLSMSVRSNFDNVKYDEDNDDGGKEASYKKDRGFTLNERLSWTLNSALADRIDIQAGIAISKQDSYKQSFQNDGGKVIPIAMETALMPGIYTPVAYIQTERVEGLPVNLTGRIEFAKSLAHGRIRHNISYGGDMSFSDNRGRGRFYDAANISVKSTVNGTGSAAAGAKEGIRGLNFNEYVRPQGKIGAYFQDNVSIELPNRRSIFANLGLRYDNQNGNGSFGPRINAAYEVSRIVKVRGGMGFASKSPSLQQLFPGDRYFDVLMADYRTNNYSFNLIQTYRKVMPRQQLSSATSWKYEAGLDIETKMGRLSVTAYSNQSRNGFGSYTVRELVPLPVLNFTFTDEFTPPTYTITGTTPYAVSYSQAINDGSTMDNGVEMYMSFKKIRALNTTIGVSGTYVRTERRSNLPVINENKDLLNQELAWGYYYKADEVNDMIRLRLTLTHHIPVIGLLTSVTIEQFTHSATYAPYSDLYPYAYDTRTLEHVVLSDEERRSERYSSLVLAPASTTDTVTPVYHNFHLRVSKEMLNGLSVSLYANNFLAYHPFTRKNGYYIQQNTQNGISFGANMKYSF